MGLKEKLKEASKTQFFTEGISPEEISKIVKTAQKRAALLRKEFNLSKRREEAVNKLERAAFQSECGVSPECVFEDILWETESKTWDYSKIAKEICAVDSGELLGSRVVDEENGLYAYAHPGAWEVYRYDSSECGFRVLMISRDMSVNMTMAKLKRGPWEWI